MLTIAPHPRLRLAALAFALPGPLAALAAPPWLRELLAPRAAAVAEEVREAIRDSLRGFGYKPTGRGKPSSEYLVRAAAAGALGSINLAVDLGNAVSLRSGVPISVVDLDRLDPGEAAPDVRLAAAGASYVFNAAGQVIDVAGLPCLHDATGPCANAVKDAQRTKTTPETRRVLVLLWGAAAVAEHTARTAAWTAELAERAGLARFDP
jgi:DNA/RNA-binding domain of Phe-tRNA-synthetase-like protein